MNYKDYYKVLGVEKTATAQEIKKTFRRLAVKYHPDKNQGNKAAEEKFKEINEAYAVLGDPEKRKKYNEMGESWRQFEQQPKYGGEQFDWSQWTGGRARDEDFGDFFETVFGGQFSRGNGGRKTRAFKGQDYNAKISITLEEAYFGTPREFEVNGKNVRIRLKPGTVDGQVVRLSGYGAPGRNEGKPGDLYIAVEILPHSIYERKGNDLYTEFPVDLFTCVLGGNAELHSLKGPVNVKIPMLTQSGKKIRMKGLGMPVYGKPDQFGDLYAKIAVRIPESLSPEEEELFRRLEEIRKKKTVNA
ncbi:MAG TPA: DnaJ C-terminal domain-containing protein [Bacteroidia bacterium]|nr:DnaJ C-terminal domain-containing protein [Bacteroidia bacterium]